MRTSDEILAAHDAAEAERHHLIYALHHLAIMANFPPEIEAYIKTRCAELTARAEGLAFALGTTTMALYEARNPD